MKPVLVSACLLGRACRYDGGDCLRPILVERLAAAGCRPVPFCPEESGGLGTPRPAAWIERGDAEQVLEGQAVVVTHEGEECTDAFRSGADQA
ncbi:purine-nucleoside phosphorylase, partial [Candidatus Woesearchaeota archaeon]|nr:purine-nucleoside phosphorylase [Candidatus Woesearchaeota archaeon]